MIQLPWEKITDSAYYHDSISALISTVLAIFISRHFYQKGVGDAFRSEIIDEIAATETPNETKQRIEKCRSSYIFRQAHGVFITKTKKLIDSLYKISKKMTENPEEKVCVNAYVNYFLKQIGVNREHPEFVVKVSEDVADEFYNCLPGYYRQLRPDDDYYNDEIAEEINKEIVEFYKHFGKELGIKESDWNYHFFGGEELFDIIYNSDEYRDYKLTHEKYIELLSELKNQNS